ncbi:MAG TPA: PAS domain-containing protein [Acidimicrobiia bacterium]|nr:PAS domain-containing protein [Acidimicrobiia bacterium]
MPEALLIAVAVIALAVVGLVAYRLGRQGSGPDDETKRLEEYDFYPFIVNESRLVEFSPEDFNKAIGHFLDRRNSIAARELIVIGEQNFIRDRFSTSEVDAYRRLYDRYDGDSVISDNEAFLENYKRIVSLLGRSFPNAGIEILLHNLVNPARSIVTLENGEVTGRKLEMGATNLVLDLKTRRYQNQDKLNYELNIGARQFKCTTIPIYRRDYGLVGAICINIDSRFIREEIRSKPGKLDAFIENLLKTEMQLEENILSPDEYQAALRGKRHYLDEAIRAGADTGQTSQLSAILFSDIVGYTTMMAGDEAAAIRTVQACRRIHRENIAAHGGRLLEEQGDGVLAMFGSVSAAVGSARDIQNAARSDGSFQLRIGIHLGEVIESGGGVFGDGVNIASRIHGVANPGTIVVSEAVHDNVKNKEGVLGIDLGLHELKGVEDPIRLYAIEV